VSTQQVDELVETATKVITDHEGKVLKNEYWGLKNLTYRIAKNRKGHYQHLGIEAPSPALHELERQFRINEDVLRYLTVRVDEIDPETPSAILKKHEERKRRERRDF
jgi:small subunit ribosomal protein S6